MPNLTLVEQALAIQLKKPRAASIPQEEVDLAIAWAEGKVTYAQVHKALNITPGYPVYAWLGLRMREAWLRRTK